MWDPYAEVQIAVLPNGLTIYCSYWPGRAFEIIECIVHSGTDQNPEGKDGIAHFVEHVVVQNGIEPHAKTEAFFQTYGNRVNHGTTGPASTTYGFCLPADPSILTEALHRFGHRLMGATLTREIEEQRLVVLAEIRKKFPSKKSWKDFCENRALETRDGKFWNMRHNLGTKTSVESIQASDLQSFYDAHYTPANMSIVCSGGVSLAELVSLFEASPFAKQIPGKRTPVPSIVTDVGEYSAHRKVDRVSERNAETERTACRFETRALLPGTVSNKVIAQLRDLLAKRLFVELREKIQLTYHVNVSTLSVHNTYFELRIICEGIEVPVIEQVEEIVDRTIMTLHECEDLYLQQCHTVRSGRVYFDPTIEGIRGGIVGDVVAYQYLRTIKDEHDEFDRMTFKDVLDVVPMIHSEKRWTKITRP